MSVHELKDPDRILIRARQDTVVLELAGEGDRLRIAGTYPLQVFQGNRGLDGSSDVVSPSLNSYLVYGRTLKGQSTQRRTRGGFLGLGQETITNIERGQPLGDGDQAFNFLERLEGHEFKLVPGGDFFEHRVFMRDVPALKLVVWGSDSGLSAYDGQRAAKVRGGERFSSTYLKTLVSLGKVYVHNERELAELTSEPAIRQLSLPFDGNSDPILELGEFPALKLGILITENNIFAFGPDERLVPVRGGGAYRGSRGGDIKGVIPVRNEMLLAGKERLFLLVDGTLSPGACN